MVRDRDYVRVGVCNSNVPQFRHRILRGKQANQRLKKNRFAVLKRRRFCFLASSSAPLAPYTASSSYLEASLFGKGNEAISGC